MPSRFSFPDQHPASLQHAIREAMTPGFAISTDTPELRHPVPQAEPWDRIDGIAKDSCIRTIHAVRAACDRVSDTMTIATRETEALWITKESVADRLIREWDSRFERKLRQIEAELRAFFGRSIV